VETSTNSRDLDGVLPCDRWRASRGRMWLAGSSRGRGGRISSRINRESSGLVGAESTASVNGSWIRNNDAQAHYYYERLEETSRQQEHESTQRATSAGILKSMATLDNDPQLADLAKWVEAGGDPRFAFSYGLAEDKDDTPRNHAVRMLEDMSERRDNPTLYELARWGRAGGDRKFALEYALGPTSKRKARLPKRCRAKVNARLCFLRNSRRINSAGRPSFADRIGTFRFSP
jgi:hypothetical protein